MARITIKSGTPVGSETLCMRCVHGHYQKGYRESEEILFCTYVWDCMRLVPFKVAECSDFAQRDTLSMEQMQAMALIISPTSTLKPVGFKVDEKVTVNSDSGETTIK